MSMPRFKLETSPSGQKVLTVYYHGRSWEEAISAGLAAYNLSGAERARIQIVALPAKESAQTHG